MITNPHYKSLEIANEVTLLTSEIGSGEQNEFDLVGTLVVTPLLEESRQESLDCVLEEQIPATVIEQPHLFTHLHEDEILGSLGAKDNLGLQGGDATTYLLLTAPQGSERSNYV